MWNHSLLLWSFLGPKSFLPQSGLSSKLHKIWGVGIDWCVNSIIGIIDFSILCWKKCILLKLHLSIFKGLKTIWNAGKNAVPILFRKCKLQELQVCKTINILCCVFEIQTIACTQWLWAEMGSPRNWYFVDICPRYFL